MVNNGLFEILKESVEKISHAEITGSMSQTYSPYFVSAMVKARQSFQVDVENGGVMSRDECLTPSHDGRLEVRMGSPKQGGAVSYGEFYPPENLERQSFEIALRTAAEETLWDCALDLREKQNQAFGMPSSEQREKFVYFSPEESSTSSDELEKELDINFQEVEELFKKVSNNLSTPLLQNVAVSFEAGKEDCYFVNSEGTRVYSNYRRFHIVMELKTVDKSNLIIPHHWSFRCTSPSKIPTYEELMTTGETLTRELLEIVKAPIQENGEFSTIVDYENHGVFWHEVIGHAVEAHRMQEDKWGDSTNIFKGKIGELIAPPFLTVIDDPTVEGLDGSYQFDEEGIPAQKVVIVENGVLREYLHTRSSAGYFERGSNGHARADGNENPCARMSNTLVESSLQVSAEQLKEDLIKICERLNKPYGLILRGSTGGETMPEESVYATIPANIFRIDRKGKEKRVRGIYVVGTPYQALSMIEETSDNYGIFNGVCGAESGWIPVTITAPDALLRSLEINRLPKNIYESVRNQILSGHLF